MFKPKTKKKEIKEEAVESVEAVETPEEEIEDEIETPEETEPTEEAEGEVVDGEEKPVEQKINLTSEEVVSIVEFNLQRAIQSLQLLK